jgi:hypothetical protein
LTTAAGLYAWCIRKNTDQPDAQSFTWLLDEMRAVKGTEYSQYYDRERMEAVMADSRRMVSEGLIPETAIKAFREISGL